MKTNKNRRNVVTGAIAGIAALSLGRTKATHDHLKTINGRRRFDVVDNHGNAVLPFRTGDAVLTYTIEDEDGNYHGEDARVVYVAKATHSGKAHGGVINPFESEMQEVWDHLTDHVNELDY